MWRTVIAPSHHVIDLDITSWRRWTRVICKLSTSGDDLEKFPCHDLFFFLFKILHWPISLLPILPMCIVSIIDIEQVIESIGLTYRELHYMISLTITMMLQTIGMVWNNGILEKENNLKAEKEMKNLMIHETYYENSSKLQNYSETYNY